MCLVIALGGQKTPTSVLLNNTQHHFKKRKLDENSRKLFLSLLFYPFYRCSETFLHRITSWQQHPGCCCCSLLTPKNPGTTTTTGMIVQCVPTGAAHIVIYIHYREERYGLFSAVKLAAASCMAELSGFSGWPDTSYKRTASRKCLLFFRPKLLVVATWLLNDALLTKHYFSILKGHVYDCIECT